MNPGRRRLLIPGLLVVLLLVVVVAAVARRAEARTTPQPTVPHTTVSVMSDPRISESSGLAVSRVHSGLAYTINDSGHAPQIFAVTIATGKVVGVTTLTDVDWRDTEAMALWRGKLWIADVGDNLLSRRDSALYAVDEPGPGNHRAHPVRYPVTFQGKPIQVEALAITPGRFDFYAKGWPYGLAYQITRPLTPDGPNIAIRTPRRTPAWTSDAVATDDGRLVLLRGIAVVEVRNARTWKLVHSDVIPVWPRGETIGLEASGRSYLIGREGTSSPLVRIAFDPTRVDAQPEVVNPETQVRATHPWVATVMKYRWVLLRVGVLVAAGLIAGWLARRRIRARRARGLGDRTSLHRIAGEDRQHGK